jgi:endonuclease YncB( thermonuclease family)
MRIRLCPARRLLLTILLAALGMVRASVATAAATDAPSPFTCATEIPFGDPVTVARITGPNAFTLADGREVRLAGIATPHRWTIAASDADDTDAPTPPDDDAAFDPVKAATLALESMLAGHTVRLAPVAPNPDRYNRIRARVELADDHRSIERVLVADGLARVEPDPIDFGCARALEQVEAAARQASLGLWALPEFAIISATDANARRNAQGRYVIVEGIVVSRGASGNRHYLNFGKNFRRDFAAVLVNKDTVSPRSKAKRAGNRFETEGFDSPEIIGRKIRVRGVMMPGGGGVIWPDVVEAIEWSDR